MYLWSATGSVISLIERTARNGKNYLTVGVRHGEGSDAVAWHIAWSGDFETDGEPEDGKHESAIVAGVKVTLRDEVTISGPISEYGDKGDRKKSMPIKRVEGATSKQFAEAVAEAF
jgi:hypothetical protein